MGPAEITSLAFQQWLFRKGKLVQSILKQLHTERYAGNAKQLNLIPYLYCFKASLLTVFVLDFYQNIFEMFIIHVSEKQLQ